MKAYIDLNNFISILGQLFKDPYGDWFRMFKEKFELVFNFDKVTLANRLKQDNDERLLICFRTLTDGFASKKEYRQHENIFPQRPLKSNAYKNYSREDLCSVYMLDDSRLDTLANFGHLLYSTVGNEVSTLNRLYPDGVNQYVKSYYMNNFSSYDFIKKHIMPCTDIIVVDRYCLSSDSLEIIEENIIRIIEILVKDQHDTSVNIVIFAYEDKCTVDKAKIKDRIVKAVKKQINGTPKVTFVMPVPRQIKIHDRGIFTNYQYLSSGDSFTQFSAGKKTSYGEDFRIFSYAEKDNMDRFVNTINNLQKIVDNIYELNRAEDWIHFDRESLFLRFRDKS